MNLSQYLDISPFDWHAIASAVLCGSIIGVERQLRGKPVGIRTATLITLGTYLFIATAFGLDGQVVDPSRVVGQVITGIGFLGAGVMLARDGAVIGVTSAACIWVLASIGVMISAGHLAASYKMALLVVAILCGVEQLEAHTKAFSRGVHSRVMKYTKRKPSDQPANETPQ
jgi:putative Mg2+ transporter-C (MgtC) family protein